MSEITQHDIHRMSLEREAIHSLAQAIAINKLDAKELGEAMRTGIDALLGQKSKQECTCDPAKGEACSNFPPPKE